MPKSFLDGGHDSLTALENIVPGFALLFTKYKLKELSFLNTRDHAQAAVDSDQGSAFSNTGTRSSFHGASVRSVYVVGDDLALLMI